MVEGKFPLIFPWKFTEFGKRFVKCEDIEDVLAFSDMGDSLMCADTEDSLAFGIIRDSVMFENIEDTIKFTRVNI